MTQFEPEFDKIKSCSSRIIQVVEIGDQKWSKRNLEVDHFANGDLIPEVKETEDWIAAGNNKQPAFCYSGNDPENGKIYGKLYNWYAITDPRGIAPEGWHVATLKDWRQLEDFLGDLQSAGYRLKSSSGWADHDSGSDSVGFNGLPGGSRDKLFNNYNGFQSRWNGFWWTATSKDDKEAFCFSIHSNYDSLFCRSFTKISGLSVRCVKNSK